MPTHEQVRTMPAGPDAQAEAARAIAEGGLVVAPTETVYGVFGSSREALSRLVGHDTAQAAAWHASDLTAAAPFDLEPWQRRLLGRLLPGPITVVLEGEALRIPEDESCRQMLDAASQAGAPRVLGAKLPIGDGREVGSMSEADSARLVEAGVSLVIDGGPTRLGRSSTVVRLTGCGIKVVREGAIEERYLDKLARRTVLFVCTGNTCRSPMAAAIARHELGDDPFTRVESAGVAAGPGAPMTAEARAALRGVGVEPGSHHSRPVTETDVNRADVIYAMTGSHLDALLSQAEVFGRATLLDPDGGDVPDPIGGPQAEYDATCRRIHEMVRRRFETLG